jgi:hypothetical protein
LRAPPRNSTMRPSILTHQPRIMSQSGQQRHRRTGTKCKFWRHTFACSHMDKFLSPLLKLLTNKRKALMKALELLRWSPWGGWVLKCFTESRDSELRYLMRLHWVTCLIAFGEPRQVAKKKHEINTNRNRVHKTTTRMNNVCS